LFHFTIYYSRLLIHSILLSVCDRFTVSSNASPPHRNN